MEGRREIDNTLSHLFRQESGKMVSVMVKIFGSEHLELAEDVVQDALLSAMESWKFRGLPENPRAWLYRAAKNKAIDIIRREKHKPGFDFTDPRLQLLTSEYTLSNTMDELWDENVIQDDFLGMMYACCHPAISQESQISFILKYLCGFSTKEVARAFLTSEETISKRLYRAKEYFRKNKLRPSIPVADQLTERTEAVLSAIYLLFNEGYTSTHDDSMIREDLIGQAFSLVKSLLNNSKTRLPEVYALMALICFHTSRIESRVSPEGELILLQEQNRDRWNRELIQKGNEYMVRAAFGDRLSNYHLEAAIAWEHCIAPDFKSTNWERIIQHYDNLLGPGYDPVVDLNKCIAVMEGRGPNEALQALQPLILEGSLVNYHLFHATLGEVEMRLGNDDSARNSFKKALSLTHSEFEKQFLRLKLEKLNSK